MAILKSVRSNEGIDVQVLFVFWKPGVCCLLQYGAMPKISCPFFVRSEKALVKIYKAESLSLEALVNINSSAANSHFTEKKCVFIQHLPAQY